MPDGTHQNERIASVETKVDMILGIVQDMSTRQKDYVDENRLWQKQHVNDDKEQFDRLHSRVSSIKKYGTAVALVAYIVGLVTGNEIKT